VLVRKWTKTDRRIRPDRVIFGHLAVERLAGSNWTQKTFDCPVSELSTDARLNEIDQSGSEISPAKEDSVVNPVVKTKP
jgi:hypothetical protein